MSNNAIHISVDDSDVINAFNALIARSSDLEPPLKLIGEKWVHSTKQRFSRSQSPEGKRWKPNSALTVSRFILSMSSDPYKKNGQLRKKSAAIGANKKPLIGESENLSKGIAYQIIGNELQVGSDEEYAAMQHFGGTTSPKSLFPNAKIPGRPFLGVSQEDAANAIDIIRGHLAGDTQ